MQSSHDRNYSLSLFFDFLWFLHLIQSGNEGWILNI